MHQTRGLMLIVLGMHRSGTSSVAGTAVRLGLAPPRTLLPPAPDNPRGFYESLLVTSLNDLIFRAAGCDWSECLDFDPARFDEKGQAAVGEMISGLLREEFVFPGFNVIKDPRLCLTLPLWIPALRETRAALSALLVLRDPLAVARSLARRDGIPPDRSIRLWLHHMLRAEHASRTMPRAVVTYDALLADWRGTLDRAGRVAGIAWPGWTRGPRPDIDGFLIPPGSGEEVTMEMPAALRDDVHEVWSGLLSLRDDPMDRAAMARLDHARRLWAGVM